MGLKEVGTLAEIGAKLGDVVEHVKWSDGREGHNGARHIRNGECGIAAYTGVMEGRCHFTMDSQSVFRMIYRAPDTIPTGPVQLRKVIVPGVYGAVMVYYVSGDDLRIELNKSKHTRADLIAARDVFDALIDAMEE